MALLTARNFTLAVLSLINFLFVFVTGVDFVRFISFRPIYHNITGGTPLCNDAAWWSVSLRDAAVLKALAVDLLLCVLAAFLTLYLSLAHSLDAEDCAYLSTQLHSKLQLFSTTAGGDAQRQGNNNNDECKLD
ncbi:nurim [Clarias magur]|uniref:Nurim n=1 Tax=Clarias magur TaxID=1594786 RepID=A0A8J4TES9_CLAMG|nr:nurim [Clarias magur]